MAAFVGDGAFWSAVVRSATFWTTTVAWAATTLALAAGIMGMGLLMARRRRLGDLVRDESGAAGAMEFTLTAPIFFVASMLIVQYGVFANDSLIVHYAAYSAARSARVHKCPPLQLADASARSLMELFCSDQGDRWDTAARLALIPAAPAQPNLVCGSGCQIPEPVLTAVTRAADRSDKDAAFRRKAMYAFDRDNVEVAIGRPAGLASVGLGSDLPAITATVRFRHYVLLPVGRLLGDGIRPQDGYFYKWGEAEVTLL